MDVRCAPFVAPLSVTHRMSSAPVCLFLEFGTWSENPVLLLLLIGSLLDNGGMATPSPNKRLMKELNDLLKGAPVGILVNKYEIEKDIRKWLITLEGAPGTLYDGEVFQLQFTFGNRYPFDSPQVVFVGSNIPVHPHVYSNGHICLSILTEDWTPAMSVTSVCLSIVSMLSSCTEKKLPPDNMIYVKTASKNPKNTRWWFHDDKV